jgi:signal peptidase complex subunit 2
MATPTKVALYNQSDLKNNSDDAIANYLNSIGFTQKHTMTDVRLAIGYGSFAIAVACFLWDYQFGFENTKLYTAGAVAVYTLLQGALAFWTSRVEEGTIYQGRSPSGELIFIASSTKKSEPIYRLKVALAKDKTNEVTNAFELSRSFTEWFDESGYFVPKPFQEFLASSISVVGKADPKRVKSASQKMLDSNPELLDAVMAANAAGDVAETTGTEKKSGGKRRKA